MIGRCQAPVEAEQWRKADHHVKIACRLILEFFEMGIYQPIANLLKCPKLDYFYDCGYHVDCGCSSFCEGIKRNVSTY